MRPQLSERTEVIQMYQEERMDLQEHARMTCQSTALRSIVTDGPRHRLNLILQFFRFLPDLSRIQTESELFAFSRISSSDVPISHLNRSRITRLVRYLLSLSVCDLQQGLPSLP